TSPVKAMVDQGADLNVQSSAKDTALHYACESGNLEIIELLIDHGCKFDLERNTTGYTPLMIATREGTLATVEVLVKAGANLE
ncbi:ankyrin, partial [Bimuria novae-zelandiae CBS 107.79]